MTDRVLTTVQAKIAVNRIKAILDGGLLEQLNTLSREGQTLSDPSLWDGRLAIKFRESWPDTLRKIELLSEQLEELRGQAQSAFDTINTAGGNG